MTTLSNLTSAEYLEIINNEGKHHESDAYTSLTTLSQLNKKYSFSDDNLVERNTIKHFTRNGILFSLEESKYDKVKDSYVKTDKNGDIMRDKNNTTLYLSTEEKIKKFGENRYIYEHKVIDTKKEIIVGKTQDEWGCLLISASDLYQKMGIGSELIKAQINRQPFRISGGFTDSGYANRMKQYNLAIRKSLANGYYRNQIKNGNMTHARVRTILKGADIYSSELNKDNSYAYCNSIKGQRRNLPPLTSDLDLSFSNQKNLVIYSFGTTAVIYDASILNNVFENKNLSESQKDYFKEKAIAGYVFIGGSMPDKTPKIFGMYARNEVIESKLHELALNIMIDSPVRVNWEQLCLLNSIFKNKLEVGYCDGDYSVTLTNPTLDLKEIQGCEKKIRSTYCQDNDQYDEKITLIIEAAYELSESSPDKLIFTAPQMTIKDVAKLEELSENKKDGKANKFKETVSFSAKTNVIKMNR